MSDPEIHIIPVTQEVRDEFSKAAFGMTKAEAMADGTCIHCRQKVEGRIHSEAGRREYQITALCEVCWDEMFADDEEDDQ